MKKILFVAVLLSGFLFAGFTALKNIKEHIVNITKEDFIVDDWVIPKKRVKRNDNKNIFIIEDIVLGKEDIIIEDWIILKSEKDDERDILIDML